MNKNLYVELDTLMPLIREQLSRGQNVSFTPRGSSMLPMLRDGRDVVTLSPLPEKIRKYDLPLYQRDNGKYILHRVVRTGETYTCIGDHQFVYETGIRHDQLIAIVTGFTRDGRYHSVQALSYKMYCRFWHGSRRIRSILQRIYAHLRRMLKRNS